MSVFVLYLFTFAINIHHDNDFYTEAWPSYQRLLDGHVVEFIRQGPGYFGSLVLRAPLVLVGSLFSAGSRVAYVATALPCVIAPAMLACWLAPQRYFRIASRKNQSRIRPLDLFMFTPPAVICMVAGHSEDILGAALCIAAVLLAQRGSSRTAGVVLGLALINKSWALIVVPLVFAVMPAERRLSALWTTVLVTALLMAPILVIRSTGSGGSSTGLGTSIGNIFVVPQLLWWFGRDSWVAREGHIIVIIAGWLATAAWWLRVRGPREPAARGTTLIILALVFFIRAAVDPWDNLYYFVPFMLALATYEDPQGFPKLTWLYAILLPIIVPPPGLLHGLGSDGHAAVFGVFALLTIAWLVRKAFSLERSGATRLYAAASGSRT